MSQLSRRRFLKTTAAASLATVPIGVGVGRSGILAPGSAPARPVESESDPTATGLDAAHDRDSRGRRGVATPSQEDPLGIRHEFPVCEEQTYLNTASQGPLSRTAYAAFEDYAREKRLMRRPGQLSDAEASARTRFARLFGADEDEIGFLYSTSDGENLVTSALDWRAGDNVVVDELHFVTTFVLYRELERRHGIELRIVPAPGGRPTLEDYAARTDDRTRLVSVAWVSNRNGYRHDLAALADLAHARGAYLYADAIQALGAFDTNLHDEGVDFACGNGYKWLFAEFGCAPFYVRREHLEWLRPDRWGHGQVAETLADFRFRLRETAEKYEHANIAYGSTAVLDAALSLLEDVGLARIEEHTVALAAELRAGVADLGIDPFTPEGNRSPIVSFRHGLDPVALAAALEAENVAVTFQEDGRLVRAAVAMFNTRADVDRLLAALAAQV